MVIKSLTITENAYSVLKSWKHGDESFSDTILRLGRSHAEHIKKFCGILNRSEAEVKSCEKEIKEARVQSNVAFKEKQKRMMKSVENDS
ncbi:MAG TPA: antitoxin VapB family protein [Candidatus Nanoarchaeia archaeon]|nr:antitoxin VapB family protein [Candidatus Nanoarchaeia archaeon]